MAISTRTLLVAVAFAALCLYTSASLVSGDVSYDDEPRRPSYGPQFRGGRDDFDVDWRFARRDQPWRRNGRRAWDRSSGWTNPEWERPAWVRPQWRRPAETFDEEDVFVDGFSLRSTPEDDLFQATSSPRPRSFFYLDEDLVGRRPSLPKPKSKKPAGPFRGRLLEVDDLNSAPSHYRPRSPRRPRFPRRPLWPRREMDVTLEDDDDFETEIYEAQMEAKKAKKTLDVVQNTEDYFAKVFDTEFNLDDEEETAAKVEKQLNADDEDDDMEVEIKLPKPKFRLPRFLRSLRLPMWIRRMWMLRFKNSKAPKSAKPKKPAFRVPQWLKNLPKFWLNNRVKKTPVKPAVPVYHYDDDEIFDGRAQEVHDYDFVAPPKAPKKAWGTRIFDRFGREFFPHIRDDRFDHFDERKVDEYFGRGATYIRPFAKGNAQPKPKEEVELFDEFGFDESLGEEEDKFNVDCKAAGGVASLKSCEADHPKMMRSLRFGKDKVIHCCRVDSRNPDHATFQQFTKVCQDKSGNLVKGSACPIDSTLLAASQSLAAVCCLPKKPAEPVHADTNVLPASKEKETLASFRDKCTSKGGIMWNNCKNTQAVLIERTQIDAKTSKVCCGDPARSNREAYKSYVRSCFDMMGIVYANRACPVGASAVLTQSRFGALEPVVCCK